MPVDLSKKSVLVVDNGLYTYLAQFLSRYFGKVYYHIPVSGPYQTSPTAHIGEGLPGVEWIEDHHKVLKKVDIIFFPDVYHGSWQADLLEQGYKVCGSGKGEVMELNKEFFKKVLAKVGLPSAPTKYYDGLDALWDGVKDLKETVYMKNAEKYRGDWETLPHLNRYQTELFLNQKRAILGVERAKQIRIMVEEKIDSEYEVGVDTFMLNGKYPKTQVLGLEIKDKGYLGMVVDELPEILRPIPLKLEPVYAKLGYRGPYSNEVRITKDKEAHPIDETCRCAEPPTSGICEVYGESYAQAIWSLAHGEMPVLKPLKKYIAQVVLSSPWHIENEIHIAAPRGSEPFLKLKNAICRNGQYYCVPNENDGIFGAAVGIGNTVKEATEECMKVIKKLKVYQLTYQENIFDECAEVIEAGRKFGITF